MSKLKFAGMGNESPVTGAVFEEFAACMTALWAMVAFKGSVHGYKEGADTYRNLPTRIPARYID